MRRLVVINVRDLTKKYGNSIALNGISFNVYQGEIFGLLGPSGAGKTTLLKILTGQLTKTSGVARIFDVDCEAMHESQYSKIGIMLDDCALYSRLTCYQNLKIFSKIHKIPRSQIETILSRVGLIEAKNRKAGDLSRGMLQRLCFANAILHSPELVLLDEPTSALDPSTAQSIRALVLELKRNGSTVVLTTHNMSEAMQLCDKVALLNNGKIIEHGNPQEICSRYDEREVTLILSDGRKVSLSLEDDCDLICRYIKAGEVRAIHSNERNLEDVFIRLTGRGLQIS